MSHILLMIVISGFIILTSCKSKNNEQEKKEKPPVAVEILIAANENVSNVIEVNGNVLADEMVELHPEISGRLTYLNIPDGEAVDAGTLLAKINDADLQAQLEQQKIQLDLAGKTEKRLKDLLAVNGVNQADYDAALSQVNNLQASIKILTAQIDKTVIKAPFSGVLGLRTVSPGAYVTPQTVLGTLHQSVKVKIDFSVPETFSSLLKKGDSVIVRTGEMKKDLPAIITAIEPQINSTTRNIKVRARLCAGYINPGAFVKVLLDDKKNGIIVPTNAIIPDAFANQVVLVKSGKAVFKNVETGVRTNVGVELLSGVSPGDSIVISGVLFVRPNAPVTIKKTKIKLN